MSLLIKGITRLSELVIDADKNWQVKGITNIKEVAALMTIGSLAEHDGSILVPFYPSLEGYVCTSQGVGKMLTWAPAGGTLKYYFPFSIDLSHALAKPAVDRSIAETGPITSQHVQAYLDDPANMIRRLDPAIALADAEIVVPVDRSHNVNARVGMDISMLVEGAVSETAAGVQTDETAAARDPTANDMHLCPMTPAVGDKYYIGSSRQFRQIWINIGTAGAGNWANQIYYWNGAWTAAADEDDGSSDFTRSGLCHMRWTMPGDWVTTTIMGMNLYWVRFMTTAFINQTIAPMGTQAWYCIVLGT